MTNDDAIRALTPEAIGRFWERVNRSERCWDWIGFINPDGYGHFSSKGHTLRAHRVSFFLKTGKLTANLDHLCRNRRCVNPSHLEDTTVLENTLRGEGPSAKNSKKTHCIHGHPFDDDNTVVLHFGRPYRRCKICHKYQIKLAARRRRVKRRTKAQTYADLFLKEE